MNVSGLSASSYDTHTWCQWRYYLTAVLGMEDESGPSAIIGHIGHKVLELLSTASIVKHDKSSKIWDVEYLWKICFDHYYNELPESAEGIKTDKLIQVAKGIYDVIDSIYTPIRDNTIAAEKNFYIPIKEPSFMIKKTDDGNKYMNIRGKIDRVDKLDEKTIEIIDYKTGTRTNYESKERGKKDAAYLHEQIQPRLYHMAAKELYPWADNILVTFIYITDGGPVSVPFCDEDIVDTKEILRKKFHSIRSNEDPQKTKSWKCNSFCSFGRKGICEDIWREKEEVGIDFVTKKYTVLNYGRKRRR